MNFKKLTKKFMKAKKKNSILHGSSKLILGLGMVAAIGVLMSTKSMKKLLTDLTEKDLTNPNELNKVIKDTVDTINNSKDNIVNKATEVKADATNLIKNIQDAAKEVKEDTNKTTKLISNETDTLTCPIKEIISD